MIINSPILFGFANMDAANHSLSHVDIKIEGTCPTLGKNSPEFAFMQAMAGYRSLTVVAAVNLEEQETYEDAVKAYIPRSISGIFDGIAFLMCTDETVVVELYRKDSVKE